MTTDWHDDECDYCRRWVRDCGDGAVRRDPKHYDLPSPTGRTRFP
jgi:hypothetical protein